MAVLGSAEGFNLGQSTGIICYPRRYMEEGAPEQQYVDCVDQAGQPLRLHIMPPQRHIEAAKQSTDQTVPSIEKLAETHRRAMNPCFATEDNGPVSPTGGVFVAEQVSVLDKEKGIYKANWLSVLRNDEAGCMPKTGIGYLETNLILPFNSEMEQKKIRLSEMNIALAKAKALGSDIENIGGKDMVSFTQERNALTMEIYHESRKFYVGVETQYRRTLDADMGNDALIRRQILELIDSNTKNGMYGGVILRPYKTVDGKRIAQVDSVRRLNHQYDYKKQAVPDVSTVWDGFIEKGAAWLKYMKKEGFSIDIIPIQRTNAGKPTTEKFSKEFYRGFPKFIRAFVDDNFHYAPYSSFARSSGYIVRPIAMRLADTRKKEYGETYLLSNIHSFGKALGHELEIDKNLQPSYGLSAKPLPAPVRSKDQSYQPGP